MCSLQNSVWEFQDLTSCYNLLLKYRLLLSQKHRTGNWIMKKLMGVIAAVTVSTFMLTGCENMSSRDQRIGTAALGGAVGGGLGSKVGGGVGAAIGGGAGAAVGSKAQGGSNRNATYSGVGGAVGSAVGKSIFGGTGGAAIGGAIGGGAGAAIEQNNRRR